MRLEGIALYNSIIQSAGNSPPDKFAEAERRRRLDRIANAELNRSAFSRLTDEQWELHQQLQHDELAQFWNNNGGFDWQYESVKRLDARRHIGTIKPSISQNSVIVSDGGSLFQMRRSRVEGAPVRGGGQRGKVKDFSRESRMRILRLIASLKRGELPVFVTLTYHHEPQHQHKKDLHNLVKRLARRWPKFSCIWRMEYQGRGVVHYHLLTWGIPLAWFLTPVGEAVSSNNKVGNVTRLSELWCKVSGQWLDMDARLASTGAEDVRNINGLFRYASKYITKDITEVDPKFDGRHWGAYGRPSLPVAQFIRVIVSPATAQLITRYARRFSKGKVRAGKSSFTLFCDARGWYDKLLLGGSSP
jgi:hypothetical protein